MRNLYVFGDFGSGRVWVYAFGGDVRSQCLLFGTGDLTSFGEDFAGEIWAVTIDGRRGRPPAGHRRAHGQ